MDMDKFMNIIDENMDPFKPARSHDIGRNDTCPCGSGKKYKKCCDRVRPERNKREYITVIRHTVFDTSQSRRGSNLLKLREAIGPLREAVSDYPLEIKFLEPMGAAYLMFNSIFDSREEAEEILERLWLLQGAEMRDDLLESYCSILFEERNWTELKKVLEQSDPALEENPIASAGRGMIFLLGGEYSRAEDVLRKTMRSQNISNSEKREVMNALWEENHQRLALEMYVREYDGPDSEEDTPAYVKKKRKINVEEKLSKVYEGLSAFPSFRRWGEGLLDTIEIVEKCSRGDISPKKAVENIKNRSQQETASSDTDLLSEGLICMRWFNITENNELMEAAGDIFGRLPSLKMVEDLEEDRKKGKQEQESLTNRIEFYKYRALSMFLQGRHKELVEMVDDYFSLETSEFKALNPSGISENDQARYERDKMDIFLLMLLAEISREREKEAQKRLEEILFCGGAEEGSGREAEKQNVDLIESERETLRLWMGRLMIILKTEAENEKIYALKDILERAYLTCNTYNEDLEDHDKEKEQAKKQTAAKYDDLVSIVANEKNKLFNRWLIESESDSSPGKPATLVDEMEEKPDFLTEKLFSISHVDPNNLTRPEGASLKLARTIDQLEELTDEEWQENLEEIINSPVFQFEDIQARLGARLWQMAGDTSSETAELSPSEKNEFIEDIEGMLEEHQDELDRESTLFYKFAARAATGKKLEAFDIIEQVEDFAGEKMPSLEAMDDTYFNNFFGYALAYIDGDELSWYLMNADKSREELSKELITVDEELAENLQQGSIDNIMKELRQEKNNSRVYTALKAASRRPGTITTRLLGVLEETADYLEEYEKHAVIHHPKVSRLPIYAMLLLAEFGEARAFPLTIDIISYREEIVDPVLGDVLTEDISQVLLSTFNGDLEALKQLIENENIFQSSRTTALQTLVMLVANGRLGRDEAKDYFAYLYREGLERKENSFVWGMLVNETKTLRLEELKPLAEMAYEEGFVDPRVFSRRENLKKIDSQKKEHLSQLYSGSGIYERYRPISDAAEVAKKWLR